MNLRIKKDTKDLDIADLDDFTDSEEEAEKNERVKPPEKRKTFPERYEVETILDQRERKGVKEMLVKWVGWDHEDNTWEPREHLEGTAEQVLMEFEQMYQETETKRKRADEQREQEAKRKRNDELKEQEAKLQDTSESDESMEIVEDVMVKGKPYVEKVKQEQVAKERLEQTQQVEQVAEEQPAQHEETEGGEDDVEINIKIKMKEKTFGKVIDKATKFLDAAAKFDLK